MRDQEQHVSDEELLLAADGELGARASRVQTHMKACACCRTKAAQMTSVLAEVAQAERNTFEAELPSIAGPGATLRKRLAELSEEGPSFVPLHRISGSFLGRTLGVAALAAVMVVACVLTFRHSIATGGGLPLVSSNRGVLPNPALTPGAAQQASLEQVCSLPHEEVNKAVSAAERERVFAEYGISGAQAGQYEVDYLITPGLGGKDDIRNLWPEPYSSAKWNALVKDALEERLHEMVCSHELDLSVAQAAIATNWIAAYRKYVEVVPSSHAGDLHAVSQCRSQPSSVAGIGCSSIS